MGNTTPIADLMAVSPVGREMFLVDVKGYRRNLFLVKRTPANARLYYILAFVPDGAPNQFFVLDQATASRLIEQGLQTWAGPTAMRIRITAQDTMGISAGITRMAIRSVIGLLASLRRAPRPSPPGPRPAPTTPPEDRSGPIECLARPATSQCGAFHLCGAGVITSYRDNKQTQSDIKFTAPGGHNARPVHSTLSNIRSAACWQFVSGAPIRT